VIIIIDDDNDRNDSKGNINLWVFGEGIKLIILIIIGQD